MTPEPAAVHIWAVTLRDVGRWEHGGLSAIEVDRAGRFRVPADRDRFVAARTATRHILAGCLGIAPSEVPLQVGPHGKPRIGTVPGHDIRFNVTHSGNVVLVAVALGREVGIDVERVRRLPNFEAVAARNFSGRECAALAALPPEHRLQAFFSCWTLKEAYLKACGSGLTRRLDAFDVTVDYREPPRLLEVRDSPHDDRCWLLTRLAPAPGHIAAVAAESRVRPRAD